MRQARRKCILIFGTVGSGKSTLADGIIKKFEGKINIIVLDPMKEYEQDKAQVFRSPASFVGAYKKDAKAVYVCQFAEDEEIEQLFAFVKIVGNCLLVIDEAEEYVDNVNTYPSFYWLLKRGRHNRTSMVCISQRVVDFPTNLRAQYTSIITFYQQLPADIKRFTELGFNEKKVRALQKFEWGKNIHDFYLIEGEPFDQLEKNL